MPVRKETDLTLASRYHVLHRARRPACSSPVEGIGAAAPARVVGEVGQEFYVRIAAYICRPGGQEPERLAVVAADLCIGCALTLQQCRIRDVSPQCGRLPDKSCARIQLVRSADSNLLGNNWFSSSRTRELLGPWSVH